MYDTNILLVEDDKRIREILRKYLEKESFNLFEAENGEKAFNEFDERIYNLIILDVMLPDMDGWTILRHIRKKSNIPVIMLTARSEEEDKLFGFELGADDYVTKPFSSRLLLARIKALLKRNSISSVNNLLEINGISINKDFRQAFMNEAKLDLTPIEYSLLVYFMDNINIALSRTTILDAVWGYDYFGEERAVDTHVKRLRKKLSENSSIIETVRGYGYRMVSK
ncbi:response regulator transcription factor [Clostridium grantii]|uniref:Stage 0 sporulation protein A homolog n=1 Tax=Clostridium grantii DSM 8605 TaxID=1121316 RepID=A0A1M5VLZ8_9CLOT|nr:response regulator transcription factor [Clostridium grantii]SHH76255.1 DNA-binding response regulator, OmpR family, contains REC and winged-helix (wHTH) domain [Clostridium grantii DSM 8605]